MLGLFSHAHADQVTTARWLGAGNRSVKKGPSCSMMTTLRRAWPERVDAITSLI